MKSARPFSFIMAVVAIFLSLFITQGIPVSHTNLTGHISGNTGRTTTAEYLVALVNVFNPNIEMFDRPVRDIVQRARFYIFGLSGFWYHFISALILGALIFTIVMLCHYLFGSYFIGIFASLYYLLSPPVWHQIPTLEENSVLTELFVTLAFFTFLKGYYHQKEAVSKDTNSGAFVRNCFSVLIFSWLALKTKGSAKIIFPVIFCFMLLTGRNLIRKYIWLLLGIFIISFPVLGRFLRLFFPQAQRMGSSMSFDLGRIYKLIVFNPDYSPSFGASLLTSATPLIIILTIAGALTFFFTRGSQNKKSEINKLPFLFLWFLAYASIYMGYPSESEPRYLVSTLLPFSVIVSFFIKKLISFINEKRHRLSLVFIIIFIFFAFGVNACKIYQLRAAHWSYWIAQENVKHFIEKEQKARNAIIFGEIELETLSQLNTTNKYVSRMPGEKEVAAGLRTYSTVYLVKHFSAIPSDLYKHKFELIKVENGEGATYFDFFARRVKSLLGRFRSFSRGHEYYIYKLS